MERFHHEKPLYPLLCIIASLVILFGGLLVSKQPIFAAVLIAVVILWTLFGYGEVLLSCLFLFVPLGGAMAGLSWLVTQNWLTALQTGGRILLMGLAAVPLISLPPIHLTRCLTQLKCPRALTLGMLVTIRFAPILVAEIGRILEAMRSRGVRISIFNPSCLYRAVLIPIVMRLIHISDTLSLSMETRGFVLTETEASVYKQIRFTVRDGVFAAMMFGLCIGLGVIL